MIPHMPRGHLNVVHIHAIRAGDLSVGEGKASTGPGVNRILAGKHMNLGSNAVLGTILTARDSAPEGCGDATNPGYGFVGLGSCQVWKLFTSREAFMVCVVAPFSAMNVP